MGILRVATIEPSTGTNLTLGTSGDTISVSSDALKLDVWKDSGGNTLFQSDGAGTLSNISGSLLAGPQLISTSTFTDQSTVSFTTGIDSSYDKYQFGFTNVIAGTNQAKLLWNASIDGGSNYNVAKTSAVYYAYQYQSNSDYGVAADTAGNLGSQNSTANIMIYQRLANYGDVGLCGYLYLATPSNTTYNKHWYSRLHSTDSGPAGSYNNSNTWYINGRLHTTSAIDAVQFQISTGTFSGTIKLYGIA